VSSIAIEELKYKRDMLKFLRSDIRKRDFPSIVVLQTLNRCNCSCAMCPYSYTVAKEDKTSMSAQSFQKILDELKKEPSFETLFFAFQNEPLLDARVLDFVKTFKEQLPNKRLELVTNGSLLTKEKTEELYRYVDMVHVSLNAHSAETHRIVSNSMHFDLIVQNLNQVAKNKEWASKTIVRFIEQKANQHERKEFKRYWNKRGFKVFGFEVNDRLKDVKEFDSKIKLPSNPGKKLKMKTLKVLGKVLLPTCPIPFLCMYIKANGDVVQCFNDWSNAHILGNVNKQSIREVFNSKKYARIRDLLLKDQLEQSVICSKCDLYKEGVWLTV
jgi:radical SAM protein with 4Fe4S-binding SPASM domain